LTDANDVLSSSYQDTDGTVVTPTTPVQTITRPLPQQPGIQLPLGPGRWATLSGDFPISEEQWRLMLSVLEAMKPGLVTADRPPDPEPVDQDQGEV